MFPTKPEVKDDIRILRNGFPHPSAEMNAFSQIDRAKEIFSEAIERGCGWDV